MKKEYYTPEMDVELFTFQSSVVTTSESTSGLEDGDNKVEI